MSAALSARQGSTATLRLFVADRPTGVRVSLVEPVWAATEREVVLTPGAREELELLVESGAGFAGTIVDADGNPVEDALVFFGPLVRMRGGSPFRAYDPARIDDGARTGADGRFTLPGESRVVSAWHAGLSPASAPAELGAELVLAARAALIGTLQGESGAPLADAEVTLDRERKTRTDARGAWRFDAVEAGIHAVRFPGGSLCADVLPGEELELRETERLEEVRVQLSLSGRAWAGRLRGAGASRGRAFQLFEWMTAEGEDSIALRRVPRRRVRLLADNGVPYELELDGPDATLDVGDAALVVRGAPATRFALLEPGASDRDRQLAAAFGDRGIGEDGFLRVEPIPRGTWTIVPLGGGAELLVEVGAGELEVELP